MESVKIEFVGGPFDGHAQRIDVPPDGLLAEARLPVSEDVFRLMAGERSTRKAPATSTAVYCRERDHSRVRYRFVCAQPPERQSDASKASPDECCGPAVDSE